MEKRVTVVLNRMLLCRNNWDLSLQEVRKERTGREIRGMFEDNHPSVSVFFFSVFGPVLRKWKVSFCLSLPAPL